MAPRSLTRTKHRIGGYRVIAPIGAGGFATVYRALNETTKEEVAIKVLAENHSLVPDTRRRFVDEVGLLSTIDSPSIAKIFELGETDTGQPYMVLELADRGDLRRRLEEIRRSHQSLNRSDLTMLAHHLYDALTTLHRAEIVHRDVSPGNILIRSRKQGGRQPGRSDGSVTLLEPGERFLLADLGHAKDLILASGFTAGGGTRGYASPEQRDDVTVVDHRADIFSATAVLEWAAHDGKYAEDLEPFFDVGLAAEPEDRFDSMEEWHSAFCEALGANELKTPSRIPDMAGLRTLVGLGSRSESTTISDRTLAVAAVAFVAVAVAALGFNGAFDRNTTVAGNTGGLGGLAIEQVTTAETGEPGLLRVEGNEDEGDGGPSGPTATDQSQDGTNPDGSTTTDSASASSTIETTMPETTTTERPETTVTETTVVETTEAPPTSAEETTTTESEFPNSPLAYIDAPTEGSVVTGDLEANGTATFPGGVNRVRVVVRNIDTGELWDPVLGEFQNVWDTFDVEVVGDDPTSVTWEFTVPEERLVPGEYLIRVWARGNNEEGDPRGDATIVLVR